MCADVIVNPLTSKLNTVLSSYYEELETTGYIPYNNVYKILVLTLIEDIYSGKFGVIIDENDYRMLSKCVTNLSGIKLIPYNTYCKSITLPKHMKFTGHRISEDSDIRFTENTDIRTY